MSPKDLKDLRWRIRKQLKGRFALERGNLTQAGGIGD